MIGRTARALLAMLTLAIAGCTEPPGTTQVEATEEPAAATAASAEVMGLWARSCALCHVTGEAGAPRLGDAQAWAPRLAQGEEVLLARTIEGFNDMPPLGYCMSCDRDDFRALIRMMAGESP